MSGETVARRLIMSGRVQGVGFRAFVKFHADKLGLDGFVRNRSDGSVEALIAGDIQKVDALIALCHEGPPASRVNDVQVSEDSRHLEKGFAHLPTI